MSNFTSERPKVPGNYLHQKRDSTDKITIFENDGELMAILGKAIKLDDIPSGGRWSLIDEDKERRLLFEIYEASIGDFNAWILENGSRWNDEVKGVLVKGKA